MAGAGLHTRVSSSRNARVDDTEQGSVHAERDCRLAISFLPSGETPCREALGTHLSSSFLHTGWLDRSTITVGMMQPLPQPPYPAEVSSLQHPKITNPSVEELSNSPDRTVDFACLSVSQTLTTAEGKQHRQQLTVPSKSGSNNQPCQPAVPATVPIETTDPPTSPHLISPP